MITNNFKNSELGLIPNDWDVKALGEICVNMRLGENYANTETPTDNVLIKMGNIQRGYISIEKIEYIKGKALDKDRLSYGMLLFNTRNTPELVGKVAIWKNELPKAFFNSNLLFLNVNDKISDSFYLNYAFNTLKAINRMKSLAFGTTSVAAIYTKDVKSFLLPLPPLPEQRRIAAALSDIDALIDNLDALIDKKRLIKQATMQQLLSGKKRINGFNDKWVMKKLGEIAETFTGLTYSPENISEYGTLVLRSSNIQNGVLTFDNNVFLNMDIPKRAMVQEDDILICVRNGSKDLIGKCALITKKALGMAFGAFMTVLRSKTVPQKFLLYLWQSEYVQKQVADNLGATINQITNADFDNFDVSLPPTLAEQTAISKILSDMDEEISLLETKKEKYTHLKQGMMSELLSGRIRI